MQRIHFYLLVGVLITIALSPGASKLLAADNRPNSIFVITDDQRCSKKSPQEPPSGRRFGRFPEKQNYPAPELERCG